MFIKDSKISFTIRTIKFLLKSKLSYSKICRYVNSKNHLIYENIRKANPKLEAYEIWGLTRKDNSYIQCPPWADGKIGISSKFTHYDYIRKSELHYKSDLDLGENSNYITALHIAYLRLRNSSKQHTHDDNKWIKDYSWYYQKATSTLCQIFEISEDAFNCKATAEVASE